MWRFKRPNPYTPHEYSKWWPMIFTFHWWNWCLSNGWGPMAKERLRLHYIRHIKDQMCRPICWLIGHKTYESADWSWHHIKCSRCRKITKRFR